MNDISNNQNDLIRLTTSIIHLRRASDLVKSFNEDLSLCIIEIANAICKDYMIKQESIDEIEDIEKKIISSDKDEA